MIVIVVLIVIVIVIGIGIAIGIAIARCSANHSNGPDALANLSPSGEDSGGTGTTGAAPDSCCFCAIAASIAAFAIAFPFAVVIGILGTGPFAG